MVVRRFYIWYEKRLVPVSLKDDGLAVEGEVDRPSLLVRCGNDLQEIPGAEASHALRSLADGAPTFIHPGPLIEKRHRYSRYRQHGAQERRAPKTDRRIVAESTDAVEEPKVAEGSSTCRAEVVTDAVTAPSPSIVKELIVSADVAEMCRRWAKTGAVAALRLPRDHTLRVLLHRLQPLVRVQRCPEMDARLRLNHQKRFAEQLGLSPAVFTSTPSPPAVVPKRSVFRSFREFSTLEDVAIVQWVCRNKAERRVNGNTIWRELQPEYPGLTGTARSWHSLRNRYLRYILNALPRLGLAPDVERRLRAAAALGEMKRRPKGESRNNSLLEAHLPKRVAGAWSRLPRPRVVSPIPEPKRPTLREEQSATLRRSPRYSDVLRAHAARHASSSESSCWDTTKPSSQARSRSPTLPAGSRRLYNPRK